MIKNRLLYTALVLISLLFVFLYKDRIVYITLYSVIMLPVASCFIAFLSRWFIKVSQSVNKDFIIKDEEFVYSLTVENKSILTFTNIQFIFAEDAVGIHSDSKPVMLYLGPKAKSEIPVTIRCSLRGVYAIGLAAVEIQDFLGLFMFRHTYRDRIKLTVFPKVVEIKNFPLSMNLLSKASSNYEIKEEDYSTVTDVRKYAPTDSYKKMHWKLTAKKNELIVKNFQSTALNATTIILDRSIISGDRRITSYIEDKIIETLVAIINYCLKKQLPVEFIYGRELHETALNISGFDKLYGISANLIFDGITNITDIFADYLTEQSNYVNIIVLTAKLTPLLYEKTVGANYFGHCVIIVYIVDDKPDPDSEGIFTDLKKSGAICFKIELNNDLSSIF